jgi:hypothetical protein
MKVNIYNITKYLFLIMFVIKTYMKKNEHKVTSNKTNPPMCVIKDTMHINNEIQCINGYDKALTRLYVM